MSSSAAGSSDIATPLVDLPSNRAARKYSWTEQLRRVLWTLGSYAIRLSPRPCFGWRRMVLRLFGAKVGHAVNVYSSTRFYMPWNVEIGDWAAIGEDAFIYSLGKVYIGAGASIAYRAHICAGTHDFSHPALPLLKPAVIVEDNAWIGTDAFIGPGVTVCKGAIVGARAVVVKDVPPMHIVGGNPARQIGVRPTPTEASSR